MYIKTVKLKNFGSHQNLELDFRVGLVGIFGPNGSGKTTLTNSIFAGITNDFSRFPGVKKDNIRDTADAKEESSITLKIEHNDVELEIYRGLRPEKNWLSVNGAAKITKVPDIQRELEQRLGINQKLMRDYIFIDQWNLFAFLSQTPGERAGAYQSLCGTGRAAEICKAIEDLLKTDTTLTVEVEDTTPVLLQTIVELEGDLTGVDHDLQVEKSRLMPEDKASRARRIQEYRKTYDRISGELVTLLRAIQMQEAAVATAGKTWSDKNQLLAEAVELEKVLRIQSNTARLTMEEFKRYRASVARNIELQHRREELAKRMTWAVNARDEMVAVLQQETAQLHQMRKPALHPEDAMRETHATDLAGIKAEIRRLVQIQAEIGRGGKTECPTCGTSVSNMKHLASLPAKLINLQGLEKQLQGVIGLVDACRGTMAKYQETVRQRQDAITDTQRRLELLERDITATQQQLDDSNTLFTEEPPPEANEADARQAIADYDNHLKIVEASRQLEAESRDVFSAAQAKLNAWQLRHNDLLAEQKVNIVADELLARATAALQRHDAARVEIARLTAQENSVRAQLTAQQTELQRLRTLLTRNRNAMALAAKLNRIKDEIMHRQALPQWVAQANLEDMEVDINDGLELFGNPFWVEATAELSFQVHFPGEPPKAAERLSGGQKAVLAMAFRPAMQTLFDADMGLLVLDEPTSGLDAQNIAFMVDALSRYAAAIHGRRQMIVISHAESLKPAFDQVVELQVGAFK